MVCKQSDYQGKIDVMEELGGNESERIHSILNGSIISVFPLAGNVGTGK